MNRAEAFKVALVSDIRQVPAAKFNRQVAESIQHVSAIAANLSCKHRILYHLEFTQGGTLLAVSVERSRQNVLFAREPGQDDTDFEAQSMAACIRQKLADVRDMSERAVFSGYRLKEVFDRLPGGPQFADGFSMITSAASALDQIAVRFADGSAEEFRLSPFPFRQVDTEVYEVGFIVEAVGLHKAQIRLQKAAAQVLGVRRRTMPLYWEHDAPTEADRIVERLCTAMRRRERVCASVQQVWQGKKGATALMLFDLLSTPI